MTYHPGDIVEFWHSYPKNSYCRHPDVYIPTRSWFLYTDKGEWQLFKYGVAPPYNKHFGYLFMKSSLFTDYTDCLNQCDINNKWLIEKLTNQIETAKKYMVNKYE